MFGQAKGKKTESKGGIAAMFAQTGKKDAAKGAKKEMEKKEEETKEVSFRFKQ